MKIKAKYIGRSREIIDVFIIQIFKNGIETRAIVIDEKGSFHTVETDYLQVDMKEFLNEQDTSG